MDGLIASAKVKLWDIVNDLAKIKPTPNLRVGLYSYGNDGYDAKVGWIRKDLDLTNDLDMLYKKLNALTTNGGTEYVTRVCRDALKEQKWSNGKDALRVIFVCGNEPASQDPVGQTQGRRQSGQGNGRGHQSDFLRPAHRSRPPRLEGIRPAVQRPLRHIDQDRAPWSSTRLRDKKLAVSEQKAQQDLRRLRQGRAARAKAENQLAQDRQRCQKARCRRGPHHLQGRRPVPQLQLECVDKLKDDPKFDITKVPEEELCAELKKLKPAERMQYVKDRLRQAAGAPEGDRQAEQAAGRLHSAG